jgi:hypothetical protein
MNGTIDDRYFEWLYSHVGSVTNRNPARSYWSIARVFYSTEFRWFVPNDDNRVEDAKVLRNAFVQEYGLDSRDLAWFQMGCSMFEMLVALCERLPSQADGTPSSWFVQLLYNLGLHRYTDDLFEISIQEEVEDAARRINNRTYDEDGMGGLFPLHHPRGDQRHVEIWYQMEAFLLERM